MKLECLVCQYLPVSPGERNSNRFWEHGEEVSVYGREGNSATPDFSSVKAVIDFLGFNPVPERFQRGTLVWIRTSTRMSQKEAAPDRYPLIDLGDLGASGERLPVVVAAQPEKTNGT